VSLDDWILALHILSAFALGGATVLFWILVYALRRTDLPEETAGINRVAQVGTVVIAVGTVGTLVFGIWLAISLDAYQVWDGWVIAAIVLWAISGETGRRAGTEYQRAGDRARELEAAGQTGPNAELSALNRTSTGLLMHAVSSAAVVLILIDMIWKPGA
jgi:uncharacterized membrane protein